MSISTFGGIRDVLQKLQKDNFVFYLSAPRGPQSILIFGSLHDAVEWGLNTYPKNLHKSIDVKDNVLHIEPQSICFIFINSDVAEEYIGYRSKLERLGKGAHLPVCKVSTHSIGVQTDSTSSSSKEIKLIKFRINEEEVKLKEILAILSKLSSDYIKESKIWLDANKVIGPKRRYDNFVKRRRKSLTEFKTNLKRSLTNKITPIELQSQLQKIREQSKQKKQELMAIGVDVDKPYQEYMKDAENAQRNIEKMKLDMVNLKKTANQIQNKIEDYRSKIEKLLSVV